MPRILALGYLVPEFPAQTHAFFWREIRALRALGVEVVLLSTREPDGRISPHSWATEAKGQTTYLYPIGARNLLLAFRRLFGASWDDWRILWRGVSSRSPVRVFRNIALLVFAAKLAEIVRKRGIRHLHCHSCGDSALISAFAGTLASVPYSLTLHGPLAYFGPGQPYKWGQAKFGVVVSQVLLRELRDQLPGELPGELVVAPMGVDNRHFSRNYPYASWAPGEALRLVSCGRLHPSKGHQFVITAVGMLRARGLNVRLNICGQDEAGGDGYYQVLKAQIDSAGLGEIVNLLGAVSEERVREELENAHMFVLGSLEEAIGVAYMEAMAMGLPVIGTRVGGVPELISDGVDGILLEPADAGRLADAVEQLARDGAIAKNIGSLAQAKVVQHFSSTRSAKAIADRISE